MTPLSVICVHANVCVAMCEEVKQVQQSGIDSDFCVSVCVQRRDGVR